MKTHDYHFHAARPVWEVGTARIMNRTICFCANLEAPAAGETVRLAAAACSAFILRVNGQFIAHGPARTGKGFFRVDEYDLTPYLTKPVNRVAIRTVGYNVNSFSYMNHTSFLCAEITVGDRVQVATGAKDIPGFTAYPVNERVVRVQRYSFQRTFAETYALPDDAFDYEVNPDTKAPSMVVEDAEGGHFIYRDIPYADDEIVRPVDVIHRGTVGKSDKERYYNSREISGISPQYLGYRESEMEYASHMEFGKLDFADQVDVKESAEVIHLDANHYADFEFPCNTTGIYEFDLHAEADGTLFLSFDEVLRDNQVVCFRMGCSNVITVRFRKGDHHMLCAMPHVMKYARLSVRDADVDVKHLCTHHIAFPMDQIHAKFVGDDDAMHRIFDAAIETFRANSVDIYMDCPSRERAGWLCDSFFTSRVEHTLTGRSVLERAFLSNFIMPDKFEYLPEGMLPMCYPSDHYDGVFIPNWAMWYGLELCEYLERTGDREFVEEARDRMYALLRYFARFENELGLLEKLESWVFIEWSKSNELTQDVSFASNMLYARLLRDFGKLYNDPALTEKAGKIKQTINDMAMTESGFYCDNAVRNEAGELVLSGERTESCQYYAFFCDIATPEDHPELWDILVHQFGYDRAEKGLYPEIYPANAFIGNYLRLDLLHRYGFKAELFDNIKGYFTYMADKTGTLWENVGDYASCNHGFASHVLYWMDQLGLIERN